MSGVGFLLLISNGPANSVFRLEEKFAEKKLQIFIKNAIERS